MVMPLSGRVSHTSHKLRESISDGRHIAETRTHSGSMIFLLLQVDLDALAARAFKPGYYNLLNLLLASRLPEKESDQEIDINKFITFNNLWRLAVKTQLFTRWPVEF
jgi:hypothetical protein